MKKPHRVHKSQKWMVGSRVRITKMPEPALNDVPKRRLTSMGTIVKVSIKFARSPDLRRTEYSISLDNEILGSLVWIVVPGHDSFKVRVYKC